MADGLGGRQRCRKKEIDLTAKEKRVIRKQRSKLVSTAWKAVRKANEIKNPLDKFEAFRQFRRECDDDENVDGGGCGGNVDLIVSSMPVDDLDDDTFEQIFDLERDNMKGLYESCDWGWHEKSKRDEMRDDRARYLIARDAGGRVLAFSHYRFDLDFDVQVLYCYELQLHPRVRRLGLGKFMLQTLELIAFSNEMRKVVLTVFKHNVDARRFFEALRYEVDDTSPPHDDNGCPYLIMSKRNKRYAQTAANDACHFDCE